MTDRGRIVVVAAGFGLWKGGRCLAAGKWTDIARLRAYPAGVGEPGGTCVAIQLRDDSEVEVRSEAPGWLSFVNTAQAKLPGMIPVDDWLPSMAESTDSRREIILFQRPSSSF